jgi:hypothetical protein
VSRLNGQGYFQESSGERREDFVKEAVDGASEREAICEEMFKFSKNVFDFWSFSQKHLIVFGHI